MATDSYSDRTVAFGAMVRGVLDIIDLTGREAWEACIAHLFIWADREPEWEIRALVDNNATAVPFGTPPPRENIAKNEMMVADLMDRAEKDPTLIDEWVSGENVLMLSADATRLVPADEVDRFTPA